MMISLVHIIMLGFGSVNNMVENLNIFQNTIYNCIGKYGVLFD